MLRTNWTSVAVYIATLVVLGLTLPQAATAQQSSTQKDTPQKVTASTDTLDVSELGTLTEQLSKGSYSSRQRATIKMWGQREQSRDEVQRAARNGDPEVSSRANWVLRQWRRGAVPGMPPHVAKLLQQGDDPAAIQELVELGRFESALIAVQESADSIEFDEIKDRVSHAMRLRFPFYIRQAMEEKTLQDLLALIDISASDTDIAICRMRLMEAMGTAVTDDNLLPAAAKTWSAADRARTLAVLLTIRGRFDDAIKVAKQMNDTRLVHRVMAIDGRWQQLTEEHILAAKDAGPLQSTRHWMGALAAADRCGDQKSKDQVIKMLVQSPVSSDWQPWRILVSHGEIETALEMIDDSSPATITDIALAASLPEYALNRLGFPIGEVDQRLDQWINGAIADQLSDLNVRSLPMQRMMCLMKCLISVGRDDDAWEIAERLSRANLTLFDRPLRDEVLQNLLSTARSDWIFKLAVLEDENSVSQSARWLASRVLPDTKSATVDYVMSALLSMDRKSTYSARFQMACELLNGDVPDRFDPQHDYQRLFDRFVDSKYVDYRQQVGVRQQSELNHDIVAFFARHGQSELATKCLQQLMMQGDIQAIFDIAVQQANSGKADVADRFYALAWERCRSKGHGNRLLNASADDAAIATKSVVGQWFLARRAGDHQRSEKLRREIELTLCSPSSDFLNQVAMDLGEHHERELPSQVYVTMLPYAALGVNKEVDFYDLARGSAMLVGDVESDEPDTAGPAEIAWRNNARKEAMRWFDLAVLFQTIDSTYFRSSAFVSLPIYIHRKLLLSAIEDRDEATAKRSVDRIMQLDYIDIGFAEDLLPKMRDAGLAKLAYETLDNVFDRGKEHMEKFPFDVTMGNNVAWVAAMNDRRLDEALVLSEQTVFFEPDSAVYRDTLAEILFRLDRREEALHVEESCLLDDPTEWHVHVQVKKYREALSKSK